MKQVWITIVVLATAGVMITAALTGIAAYYVLGIPLVAALLLGATLASTDPATLVPIFQQVKIRARAAQTVVSESALNDATGAITTFGVLVVPMGTGDFSLGASLLALALLPAPPSDIWLCCSSRTNDWHSWRNMHRW